jgi:hypothetical protein
MDHSEEEANSIDSRNILSVQQSIDVTLQYHMNQAFSVVPDERDFLRPWRRRLRDILATKNEDMIAFLEKPCETWEGIRNHDNFIKDLERSTGMTSSKWMEDHITPMIKPSEVLDSLEKTIGTSLASLRSSLHTIMDLYQISMKKLFDLNTKLVNNITILNNLKDRLGGLSDLDTGLPPTPELSALQTSILEYIRSCYESLGIQEVYESFCAEYTRFTALRSVIQSVFSANDRTGAPVCSICTTERITAVLIPCGHTFCNSCSQKQRNICFLCRCPVRDRQRMYFA